MAMVLMLLWSENVTTLSEAGVAILARFLIIGFLDVCHIDGTKFFSQPMGICKTKGFDLLAACKKVHMYAILLFGFFGLHM